MFLGGSIGVFYIAFSAVAVQYVGVLEFTLLSVGGMLIGSLLLDVFAPTQGTHMFCLYVFLRPTMFLIRSTHKALPLRT